MVRRRGKSYCFNTVLHVQFPPTCTHVLNQVRTNFLILLKTLNGKQERLSVSRMRVYYIYGFEYGLAELRGIASMGLTLF